MQAKLYYYSLPIKTQLILRGREIAFREGLIIELSKNGKVSFGEISPLPFFSKETLIQAKQQVIDVLTQKNWEHNLQLEKLYPSVAFGLSCALAELTEEKNHTITYSQDSVILFKGEINSFIEKLEQQKIKLGKIKVGIQSPKIEAKIINQLFEKIPNLKLRLDANQKWSWEQAVQFGENFSKSYRSQLDFIEEPCKTAESSLQFADKFNLPIAWDESAREPNFLVKKQKNVTAIIIKPTLTGSLEKCKDLIQQTHQQGMQAVISSSIETSLALSQLDKVSQQYTPNTPAGLDTLDLMQHQLLVSFRDSPLPVVDLKSEYITEIRLN